MNQSNKVKSLDELEQIVASLRAEGKKVVMCHGVFDLLHIGHIRHFEQARRLGDELIVTISPDRFVDKGPHRPAFTETLRVEAIASLGSVSYAAINEWPTAEETLKKLKPDIFVKGSEFKEVGSDATGKIEKERKAAEDAGVRIAFTEDIVFSSSNLINRYLSELPNEIREYLDVFRQREGMAQALQLIEKMSSLKVLVVGDAILDEYRYCEAIGKSSKDPVLVVNQLSTDLFAGGALAVANHVANFAGQVKILTVLGEEDSQEQFIRSNLHPAIEPLFRMKPGGGTLVKRRYIEGYTLNKLFEVYVSNISETDERLEAELCGQIAEEASKCDLVIVSDFGHGAITDKMAKTLEKHSPALAINVQANAGNRGFHTVRRYERADYVCIAEHEVRLEMRDLKGDVPPMAEYLGKAMGCSQFTVTRGRKGCLVWNKDGDMIEAPSFAQSAVDRIGAGDAFLSVTALAFALGAPIEILGFLGNIAGSLAVGIVGNQKAVDKGSVVKYITSLSK